MRTLINIALAGRTFSVRPLTLRQVEALEAILAVQGQGSIAQGVRIVAAGLARDHADMTDEVLYAAEITPHEIATAAAAVLRQAGFLQGEAPAAAGDSASTGGLSADV